MKIVESSVSDEVINIIENYSKMSKVTMSQALKELIEKGADNTFKKCIANVGGIPETCYYIGVVPDAPEYVAVSYYGEVYKAKRDSIFFID